MWRWRLPAVHPAVNTMRPVHRGLHSTKSCQPAQINQTKKWKTQPKVENKRPELYCTKRLGLYLWCPVASDPGAYILPSSPAQKHCIHCITRRTLRFLFRTVEPQVVLQTVYGAEVLVVEVSRKTFKIHFENLCQTSKLFSLKTRVRFSVDEADTLLAIQKKKKIEREQKEKWHRE